MNFFKKFLKNKFVLSAVVLAAVAGIGGAATVAEFGPSRPTKAYVQGQPGFDHVTFNSFTGVPNIGDERDFMTGKIAGAPNGFYDPMNKVRDGNEILVRVYVHNNADSSKNASGDGIARNTKVRVQVPQGTLASAHQTRGYISADNAQPQIIHDTLDMNADYPFMLDYIEGSAQITTNFMNDRALSDEIINGGVLIGDDALDGQMPGCFEYTAVVTFKVRVEAPNYKVEKQVRNVGEDSTKWRENASAKPGDEVEWMVTFTNTGKTQLNEVVIFDQLPQKTTLVSGSTKIYNTSNPSGVAAGTDAVAGNGIKVGNYTENSNARVVFKTKIANTDQLTCGMNILKNEGYAKPEGHGAVKDDATVNVEKECKPENPQYSCDLLTAERGQNRKVKYVAKATAVNGAEIKNYTYDFGDGKTLSTKESVVEHTYEKDGRYTARVKVNVGIGSATHVAESEKCAVVVDFNTPVTPASSTKLPETGAGSTAAIFAAVTAFSAAAYHMVTTRRSSL